MTVHRSHSLKLCLLLSSLLVGVAGCGGASNSSTEVSTPATSDPSPSPSVVASSPSPSAVPSPQAESTVISDQGIGAAQLGITLGDLKQSLPADTEFTVQSPFITDFDAIAVQQNGEPQYYILYLANESFGDEDVIQGVLTDNPKFQTEQGVGAGTSIAEAESAYGEATLSYNTQNESREYVRFEQQPSKNVSFATGSAGDGSAAGLYEEATDEYNETKAYREDATIQSVLVICLREDCAPRTSDSE